MHNSPLLARDRTQTVKATSVKSLSIFENGSQEFLNVSHVSSHGGLPQGKIRLQPVAGSTDQKLSLPVLLQLSPWQHFSGMLAQH